MHRSVLVSQTANRCINLRQLLACTALRNPRQPLIRVQETGEKSFPYYVDPNA